MSLAADRTDLPPAEDDADAEGSRPLSRLTASLRMGAMIDRATIGAMRRFLKQPEPRELERIQVEVEAAIHRFGSEGWIDDPESFHRTPPPLVDVRTRGVSGGPMPFEWVTWQSDYTPHTIEPGRARWQSYRENRVARAAVLRHRDATRPWLICVHGFGMGRPLMDIPSFKASRLHHKHGFNLAFPVLPLHGSRRSERLSRFAGFPSVDMLDDVHAAAQAAWDVRRLISWIRAQGPSHVGIQGMSLGGFTTALVSSLEPDLSFSAPLIPATDLSRLLLDNAERMDSLEANAALQLVEQSAQVLRVVAPLEMTPKVDPDRRFIVAGTVDGMARPSRHAEPLWEHWDRPPIKWFHGAHTSVFRARGVGSFLDDAWRSTGMLAD